MTSGSNSRGVVAGLAATALAAAIGVAYLLLEPRERDSADGEVSASAPVAAADEVLAGERHRSKAAPSRPRQTYRGPDGRTQLIDYGNAAGPAEGETRSRVRAALLDDVRHHPDAIARAYGLDVEQVRAITMGSPDPLPDALESSLPERSDHERVVP
jgi:hypothetical protein